MIKYNYMNKVFLAIAAVAALAACSKSDVEYAQTGEISFVPVAKNMTKSMMTGTTFQASESFNVWAWYNQTDDNTAVADWDTATDKYYFEEATFVNRGGTSWGGATPYYWPKVGSLLFAGYYPVEAADKASYEFDGETNQMVFTGYEQSEVAETGYTEDLMYFNMTENSHNSGPVAVVFKHALSWVTVNLARTSDNPADDEGNIPQYPEIKVNSVTFTNVNPEGTGTVVGTDGDITWTLTGTPDNTVVTPAEGVVLEAAPQTQTEPLFIPQVFTDKMELQVNYTISSSATESFSETYTVALKGMSGTEGEKAVTVNSWEDAKHYTYNITIGLEEILIEPTVADWTPVTVEVPVP